MSAVDDVFDFVAVAIEALQGGDRKTCQDMLESAHMIFNRTENFPEPDRIVFLRNSDAIVSILNEHALVAVTYH